MPMNVTLNVNRRYIGLSFLENVQYAQDIENGILIRNSYPKTIVYKILYCIAPRRPREIVLTMSINIDSDQNLRYSIR